MFTEQCGVSFITIHMIILNTLEKSDWQEWQPSEDRSISNSKGCSFVAVYGYSSRYGTPLSRISSYQKNYQIWRNQTLHARQKACVFEIVNTTYLL